METSIEEDDRDQEPHILPPQVEVTSITSSAKFLEKIEAIRSKHNLSYMDAVLFYCEEYGMEVETAASIIKSSSLLKARIQAEAEELHFLPKVSRLPVE